MYAITLKIPGSNGGQSKEFTQHIKCSKIDDTAPAPAQPIEKQDLSSTYYYMYNYHKVVDMSNTNLLDAMNSLKKMFVVGSSDRVNVIQNYQPPSFEIHPETYQKELII